ncbi:uncharacterized protein [Nicotiana sylvestris]|uniref:uncharacterized protein n=1 Tax=Nicotiana sylvestris TaxID=4096 RepID=UPI00388C6013
MVGFYLNWFRISTKHSSGPSTMKKKKMRPSQERRQILYETHMVQPGEGSSTVEELYMGPNAKFQNWKSTLFPIRRESRSNNAALNNMTCLRTSCPDPNPLSNYEIMNQEPEYDEEEAFREINRELEQFENKPKSNLNETEPLKAGVIRVVRYTTSLANVVPVPKKDEKTRVCVDYKDLNKAGPNYNFPLPNIHILVDNCAKHEIQSFVDCYAGYHQVLMDEEDAEKTTFTTPWGTYCYRVMPFVLKNARKTYMRAMTAIFHDMMHQESKFSRRGIELDPTKIKSIRDLPHPRTKKEVMRLLGRLNYISRFIALLVSTCEPIFKMLKKDAAIKWMDECQEAFDKIKEYLSNPPILVTPEPGRPLFLYLIVLENSFGCVLRSLGITCWPTPPISSPGWTLEVHIPKTDAHREPLNTYFPDEEVNSVKVTSEDTNALKMFFDGAVNAKGVGIGVILISHAGQHYPAIAQLWFFYTNNTAEYEACIMGMNMAINQDVEELLIMGDSDLIIRQAHGEWETWDVKLIPYKQHVEDLIKQFKSVEFRERRGYYNMVEVEPNVHPWYHDIKRFLRTKEYPRQASGDQKRTIRWLASDFFLSGEVFYKRTPDLNLLRCVDVEEAGSVTSRNIMSRSIILRQCYAL